MTREQKKIEGPARLRTKSLRKGSGQREMLLTEVMEMYRDTIRRHGTETSAKNVGAPLHALLAYRGKRVRMSEVNKDFIEDWIEYLRFSYTTRKGRHLSPNTVITYCNIVSAALNMAVRKEIIAENPFRRIAATEKVKATESLRAYLTLDELQKMMAAKSPRDDVKRAYLFSCFCGMRISDIRRLRWKDIGTDGAQWRATIMMQKTAAALYLPLNKNAVACLPKKDIGNTVSQPIATSRNDLVFGTLPTLPTVERILKRWTKAAGIDKHITFHTARHTFATLMLTLGVDLYTTSQLLGHTKISTTQIYAKVVNKKKDEAVGLIDRAFALNL